MSINLRSTSFVDWSVSFSVAVPMPSGVQAGDVVVVNLGFQSFPTVATPSGWTRIAQGGNNRTMAVFAAVMPSSPPANVTFDWSASGSGSGGNAVAAAYTGVNNASPYDGINGTVWDNAGTALSLVTGHGSAKLIVAAVQSGGGSALSTPTGYTKEVERNGSVVDIAIFDLTAGTAGTYSTNSPAGALQSEATMFALNAQAPPLAPTLTTPGNASYQDLAAGITFGWTYNPATSGVTQTAYALRRKIGAGAYEWWNAGTVAWQGTEIFNTSGSSSVAFAASKWANGTAYNWSVATQDSNGTGTYSADNTVTGSVAPTATVTGPTGTVAGASPSVSWTETVQAGASQTAYRVVIESGAYGSTPGSGVTVWDSSVVGSSALTVIVGTTLSNGGSYRAFVQVTETGGQASAWAFTTFTVTYNTPATPSIIAVWDSTLARCALAVQGRDNLLTANASSIETDATAWGAATNCTFARSTTQSLDGTASLALTSLAAGEMYVGTSGLSVVGGKVYTAISSFRAAASPRNVGMYVNWFDSSNTFIRQDEVHSAADNTAGWQQTTLTVQSPANAAVSSLYVRVLATGAAAEVHYVDRIGLFPDPLGNLVTNQDFESGVTGWAAAAGNSALAASTLRTYTGRGSMLCTWSTTATQGNSGIQTTVPAIAGVAETLSAWVYVPTGSAPVAIHAYDIGNVATAARSSATSITNAWQRLTVTLTPTTSSGLNLQIEPQTNALGTCSVDAAQAVVGSTAQPYVPPSYSNLILAPSSTPINSTYVSAPQATVTSSSNQSLFEATSFKCVAAAGFSRGNVGLNNQLDTGTSLHVSPGGTYTASVYIYNPSVGGFTGGLFLSMQGYAGGTYQEFAHSTVDTATVGAWTRMSVTLTLPANFGQGADATLRFFILNAGTISAGAVFYASGWQFELGSVANPYVDGAQGPGYSWDASQNLLSAAAASFEDGTTGGWLVAGSASVANSATRAVSGTKSLAITLTTQSIAFSTGSFLANTLAPNTTYTASAYVYNPTTGGASGGVAVRVDNGSGPVYVSTTTTTRDTWVRVVLTFTTDSTGQANFFVANAGASTAGNVVYLDAVQYEQRSYATPYNQTATANVATSTYQQPWTIGGFAATGIYVIEASEDGGTTWKTVRGATALTVDSAANQQITAYDYERTPGATATYRARVFDVSVTSLNSPTSSCVVSITSWWVKDVTNPALNKAICDAQQHVRNRKGDSAAIYPTGRTNPVVLRGPVHGADGQMRTVVSTEADRTAILNLFTAQASMLLQDPRGRQWYAEWIGDLTETQVQSDPTHPIYAIQRNWVEVDVPG